MSGISTPAHGGFSVLSSLCAEDIARHRFERAWRGYNCAEVERFLRLLSEQTAQMRGQTEALAAELQRSGPSPQHQSSQAAQPTGPSQADGVAAPLREAARAEAQALLAEAEQTAEQMMGAAREQAERERAGIAALRQQRLRLLEEMRGVVTTHARLLDVLEDNAPLDDPPLNEQPGDEVLASLDAPQPPPALAEEGMRLSAPMHMHSGVDDGHAPPASV